ncbi:MAG: hypothetical protein GWN86_06690, partial [Desulfobacterales bacterium]|nr:hypothetical protein [Desulfobacterales bacterium]
MLQLEGEHVIQLQVRDVTERIRLEEQLRHSQKMEAVGTLTAGVAHEFNNIMTSILGFGEFLQDDLPTENRLREYADKIVYSAKRAARLTESLMAYSRKQITRFVPVDMNDLLCSVKDFLFGLVGENIELNVEPSVEPLPVLADPNQIEQSILNLVANARDAMPEGGSLTITARKFNPNEDESDEQYAVLDPIPYILISVSDTGMGIAHEIQEKLFEPFFTTKEVGKGTGLGLSMVYGIVRRHNGHIVVKSE